MGLRSWWADQKQAMRDVDERRAADRARTIARLEPVIAAERARGNAPVDHWHQAGFGGPDGVWFERHLAHPLDVAALQAEFDFDDAVWLRDNRVGSQDDAAVLLGGSTPLSPEQHSAREQWWAHWRAAPRPRRRLSKAS
jgi:hypothetical protein